MYPVKTKTFAQGDMSKDIQHSCLLETYVHPLTPQNSGKMVYEILTIT